MKKLVALMLAVCLTATLASCGESRVERVETSSETSTSAEPYESESAKSDTEPDTEADTKSDTESPKTAEKPVEKAEKFQKDSVIEDTVLVDENGVKITANNLSYTDYSFELELTIENNSDKDLSFVSGSFGYSCNSINGYMTNAGYLNCDVAAGKKARDSISFSYDSLLLYGINEIADMEIGFDVTDDDYNHIYYGTSQLKTSAYDRHDYGKDYYPDAITSQKSMSAYGYDVTCFSRDTIYDVNGIKLISNGIMVDKYGNPLLLLEFENSTSDMVNIALSDIAVNGLLIYDLIWSRDSIASGKTGIIDIDLSSVINSEYRDAFGIGEIGSVRFSVGQRNEVGDELAEASSVEVTIPDVTGGFDNTGTELYNSNGLRIAYKTLMENPSKFSGNMEILLLAENTSEVELTIDDVYDSLSVNGFMIDYSFYGIDIDSGESAILEIELWKSSLEKNKITSVTDISEVELGLEIKSGWKTVDEIVLNITPQE